MKKEQLVKGLREIVALFEEADGIWINLQGKDRLGFYILGGFQGKQGRGSAKNGKGDFDQIARYVVLHGANATNGKQEREEMKHEWYWL